MKNILLKLLLFVLLLVSAFLVYGGVTYLYTAHKFIPIKTLAPAENIASAQDLVLKDILFIHAVNTPARARAKDARYSGFEIDLNLLPNGQLVVAHDETHFKHLFTLDDILSAIQNPASKSYWVDLKAPLKQANLNDIKKTADLFGVPYNHFIFETIGGEAADLLQQNGFMIVLQVIDGFEQDDGSPTKRAKLNAALSKLLEEYHPAGVSASLGKYVYLRQYFPQINKVIYSNTTKRPSLKKYWLEQQFRKDDAVKIFMIDEYTALSF